MTDSLPLVDRTPLDARLSMPVSPAPSSQGDSSSEFLKLLEQQLFNSDSTYPATMDAALSGESTPKPPGTSLSPALAQAWASAVMQRLPVPGLDGSTADSTIQADAWNSGSDSFLSTYALLQQLQGNQSGVGGDDGSGTPAPDGSLSNGRRTANLARLQPTVQAAVDAASAKYGLPKNLIYAVIDQESGMDPNAVSGAGALGLMQLMPDTARALGVTNPFDPVQNVDAGTRYLSNMLQQFRSIPLALAAYNAGPGAVQSYGGIPPYAETQNYVKSIMAKASL